MRADGHETPALDEEPNLSPIEAIIYVAFIDLGSCRNFHMGGLGPIPWCHVKTYADEHELDLAVLWPVVRELDNVLLEHASKKVENGR